MTILTNSRGIAAALGAAVLFGASTPAAKILLGNVGPWLLAGLFYFGSGVGLMLVSFFRASNGADLTRHDWPWMIGAVAAGGVAGPVLLMWGLSETTASTASLLLNAEGVFTALIAWFVFRENFNRRIALGMAAIITGAVVLSSSGTTSVKSPWPLLAILGACLCWAVDNNLTRKVSLSDPFQIAAIKGLVAGVTNVGLAVAGGIYLPSVFTVLASGFVGFLGYGVSLALFVVALRELGTARTGAYFSIAPFIGVIIAITLLGEPVTTRFLIAGGLMTFGVWVHLTERHEHEHEHKPIEHSHAHVHDDRHHDHRHRKIPKGAHLHQHRHEPMWHKHPHYPDAHHRHEH